MATGLLVYAHGLLLMSYACGPFFYAYGLLLLYLRALARFVDLMIGYIELSRS